MNVIQAALVTQAAAGDERAFASLVDLHYERCLRYALNLLGEQADAEEAVQDAFVRVYRALPRYREEERFEGWLYRIVVNCCRTLASRRRRRDDMLAPDPAVLDTVPARDHADETVLRQEIQRALAQLPVEQREAFLLHHVEGLDYQAMAKVTGAGVSALKMRVKRAADRLQLLLREVDRV